MAPETANGEEEASKHENTQSDSGLRKGLVQVKRPEAEMLALRVKRLCKLFHASLRANERR